MKHYIAMVTDPDTRELLGIRRDYKRKSDFYRDLRGNGYHVRFITTEENFDADCAKWHERNDLSKAIHKAIYASDKMLAERKGMSVAEYRAYMKLS